MQSNPKMQNTNSITPNKMKRNFKFQETFSKMKMTKQEVDLEEKMDTYENKLEEIFENNFDVFNGFMTIKTPFMRFKRPEVKVVKPVDQVKSTKDIDDMIQLLKRTLTNDEFMRNEFNNRKKNLLKLKINKNVKEKESNNNEQDDCGNNINTQPNTNSKNVTKNIKLQTLPSIKISSTVSTNPTSRTRNIPNSPSHFTLPSHFTCQTEAATNNNTSNYTTTYRSPSIQSHKTVLTTLLNNFNDEEKSLKLVSRKITKIKNFDFDKLHKKITTENDIYEYKNLKDMTKSKNLFSKKKEVLFFKNESIVRDKAGMILISNPSITRSSPKEFDANTDRRRKIFSLLDNNILLKGNIENVIKRVKRKTKQ